MTPQKETYTVADYIERRYGRDCEDLASASFIDIGVWEAKCFERFDYGELVDRVVEELMKMYRPDYKLDNIERK